MMRANMIAVVTARGGSVGFPDKNLALFRGRELTAHAVATAVAAESVARVIVTTDSERLARVGADAGAEIVPRPGNLAGPSSRSIDAVIHALDSRSVPDVALVALVQPTSPLRTPGDIDECAALYEQLEAGSVIQMSAVADDHHPLKTCLYEGGRLHPIRQWEDLEAPRQELPSVLRPTGGVYVARAGDLRRCRRFFIPRVVPQIIPAERALDVDTPDDLAKAERRALEAEREHRPL